MRPFAQVAGRGGLWFEEQADAAGVSGVQFLAMLDQTGGWCWNTMTAHAVPFLRREDTPGMKERRRDMPSGYPAFDPVDKVYTGRTVRARLRQ